MKLLKEMDTKVAVGFDMIPPKFKELSIFCTLYFRGFHRFFDISAKICSTKNWN